MLYKNWLDLQFFAGEGASAGDGGGESAGVESADAGQSFEDRLADLGVPKNKIRKGAYKGSKAQPAAPAAPAVQETQTPEAESGAADRKSWDEVKAGYKTEYDAEVQGIIQKRLKNSQAQIQQYTDREEKIAPVIDFLAKRYGLDAENLDYDELLEKFRGDNSLSAERALEMGTTDEVAHRLDLMELEEKRNARKQQLQQAFDAQRQSLNTRFDELNSQAQEFAKKVPGFDLMREIRENPAFATFTQPGSTVTVEQAYYATHPEFRQAEAESVAKRATEAVASSVRAGASRPQENGTQAASIGSTPYSQMSKADREAWKQRARAAAARGEHLIPGR